MKHAQPKLYNKLGTYEYDITKKKTYITGHDKKMRNIRNIRDIIESSFDEIKRTS